MTEFLVILGILLGIPVWGMFGELTCSLMGYIFNDEPDEWEVGHVVWPFILPLALTFLLSRSSGRWVRHQLAPLRNPRAKLPSARVVRG